jgi:hypothetical protein
MDNSTRNKTPPIPFFYPPTHPGDTDPVGVSSTSYTAMRALGATPASDVYAGRVGSPFVSPGQR